jgi:hypothetical protein
MFFGPPKIIPNTVDIAAKWPILTDGIEARHYRQFRKFCHYSHHFRHADATTRLPGKAESQFDYLNF